MVVPMIHMIHSQLTIDATYSLDISEQFWHHLYEIVNITGLFKITTRDFVAIYPVERN